MIMGSGDCDSEGVEPFDSSIFYKHWIPSASIATIRHSEISLLASSFGNFKLSDYPEGMKRL